MDCMASFLPSLTHHLSSALELSTLGWHVHQELLQKKWFHSHNPEVYSERKLGWGEKSLSHQRKPKALTRYRFCVEFWTIWLPVFFSCNMTNSWQCLSSLNRYSIDLVLPEDIEIGTRKGLKMFLRHKNHLVDAMRRNLDPFNLILYIQLWTRGWYSLGASCFGYNRA